MIIKEFKNKTAIRVMIFTGISLIILGIAILSNQWADNLLLSFFSKWKGISPASNGLDKLHQLGVDLLLAGMIVVGDWLVSSQWHRTAPLKQNKFITLITPVGEILLIWLLIAVNKFSFDYID